MPDIVVMFFLLGLVAGLLKSDLSIPKEAYDTLSLLLMLTIGLKGGMALFGSVSTNLIWEMLTVALVGAICPLLILPILRFVCGVSLANASSIAAHYGSVSAGTFAVVLTYVESNNIEFGAQTTLYLVMLELPAIIVALAIYRFFNSEKQAEGVSHRAIWHETLTNRGVVLLVGGVLIGWMYGPVQGASVTELLTGGFKAILAIFMLEMGLTAAETLRPFPYKQWKLVIFACVTPLAFAAIGAGAGIALGLPEGSVLILATLVASASYIAAPAAIRSAIPDADIGLAMLLSLGLTFPLNVIFGIPLYHSYISQWIS